MQRYILSIVGMIIVSVVCGVVLPEGRMSNFLKSSIALFLFFVIVSPIIEIATNKNNLFKDIQIEIQQEFLSSAVDSQVDNAISKVENSLRDNFFIETDVEIVHYVENNVAIFKSVEIWITNINKPDHTIDIDDIKNHVASLLKIDKEVISVYK